MHERSLLEETGGFDESLRRNVDWDYLIRLSHVTDFAFAPFIATRYDLWETGTGRITTSASGESASSSDSNSAASAGFTRIIQPSPYGSLLMISGLSTTS